MPSWRERLLATGHDLGQAVHTLNRWIDDHVGNEPITIVPYHGYGNAEEIVLRGRVLEANRATVATDEDSLWRNLMNIYQHFESDEIPDADVRGQFLQVEASVATDSEGYFTLRMPSAANISGWQPVHLELLAPLRSDAGPVTASGEVFLPQPETQFGIISDIDDTVVQTNATNMLRMARSVFLSNARTRLPFPGVAALYQALHSGAEGPFVNPLFYVSSSPWNLYPILTEFFRLRGLPGGTMFLRDWGVSPGALPVGHRSHKLTAIEELLAFYPTLPFLLIGDSGQEDPEIYAEVVRMHPGRIKAIYIRSVDTRPERLAAIQTLAEEVLAANSMLVLADTTLAMAEHAAEHGWITRDTLERVAADTAADAGNPGALDELLDDNEAEVVDTHQPAAAEQIAETLDKAADEDEPPTLVVEPNPPKA